VHDGIELERRGVATGVVITEPFVRAAAAMARIDGFAGYRVAVVAHPTADLDDARLAVVAAAAAEQLIALVSGELPERSA